MKVAHLITGLNNGGAESALFRLCKYSETECVAVISMLPIGKYGEMFSEIGIKTYSLEMKRGIPSFTSILKLFRLLRTLKPDVVQTWMYHANLLGGISSYLAGCWNVIWGIHHSDISSNSTKITTKIVIWLLMMLSRIIPSAVIFCSRYSLKIHAEFGFKCSRMLVIPNGYDTNEFRQLVTINKTFFPKIYRKIEDVAAPKLGMVARYDPLKDHDNLLKSLNILKCRNIKFQLFLVGSGICSSNSELVDKISSNGLTENIVLLGESSEINTFMNIIDIHILSSKSEAFPNVVAEAMACSTPCIVTDVGDSAYIVGDYGWVVPPGNEVLLAKAIDDAIRELVDSPHVWLERKRNSRNRIVSKFDIAKVCSLYNEVWVINEKNRNHFTR